jgi:O-succinylbenzoic acid--CoA ligase
VTLSIRDAAREQPDHAALVTHERTWTFRALAERVEAVASGILAALPPSLDGPVALDGRLDERTLTRLLALIELGRPALLLHPRWTAAARREYLHRAFDPPVLDAAALPRGSGRARLPTAIDAEAPLAIVATSGTSATPKGVVLSRRAFVASAAASEKNLGWKPDDRWLLALPLAHVGGLSIVTRCLIARRTIVVARPPGDDPAEALVRQLERDHITLLSLVPTQLRFLLDRAPRLAPPPSLRAILLGGAPAPRTLLDEARERGFPVLTTYGLTEASSQVTTQPLGSLPAAEAGAGKPLDGTDVRIVGGTIRVRGPTLLSGYHPDDDAPLFDSEGFFDTRDHGTLDQEGNLHVLGRGTDTIITGGENVYPLAVERIVQECPGVVAACAFGEPDETWGQIVAVAVVAGPAFSVQALERHVLERLAPFERPRRYALVAALEATGAGKLDRAATAQRARAGMRSLDGA